jgi:hypothetical protein
MAFTRLSMVDLCFSMAFLSVYGFSMFFFDFSMCFYVFSMFFYVFLCFSTVFNGPIAKTAVSLGALGALAFGRRIQGYTILATQSGRPCVA